ncbi:hypothetical protein RDWZM_004488 [Blomia tropicalis]|uniref:N-acetyltransferase domain-containing protein n=1 Tax=Blomia tropicalis TaxID=40697 RepID=A0A9Q0RLF9_BLOTA|nr:hypothetical protein RDWZM_004488 [Blomia tropicalis]
MSSSNPQLLKFVVREAKNNDYDAIYRLIYDLANYQNMGTNVSITAERLRKDGSGEWPHFNALVVERIDADLQTPLNIIGYSIYNRIFSITSGRVLWVEDIYIDEQYRELGLAGAIIRKLAECAQKENMNRIEWNVLGWNQLAIGFYQYIGAMDMTNVQNGRHVYRLTHQSYKKCLSNPN